MNPVAKVYLAKHDATLTLSPAGVWSCDDEDLEPLVQWANIVSAPPYYDYSPSHGMYGARIASQVAMQLDGELWLAPVSTLPAGAVS